MSVEGFSREFLLRDWNCVKVELNDERRDPLNAALLIGQSQDLNIRSRAIYLSRLQ